MIRRYTEFYLSIKFSRKELLISKSMSVAKKSTQNHVQSIAKRNSFGYLFTVSKTNYLWTCCSSRRKDTNWARSWYWIICSSVEYKCQLLILCLCSLIFCNIKLKTCRCYDILVLMSCIKLTISLVVCNAGDMHVWVNIHLAVSSQHLKGNLNFLMCSYLQYHLLW